MKRRKTAVSMILSPDEFDILQKLADETGVSKSEYLRLIIQGIWLGRSMSEGKQVKIGGYGYSFDPQEMESLFKEVASKLEQAVNIDPVIGNKAVRYKRIKTSQKVA